MKLLITILTTCILSSCSISSQDYDYKSVAQSYVLSNIDKFIDDYSSGLTNPLFIDPKLKLSTKDLSEVIVIKCPSNYLWWTVKDKFDELQKKDDWKDIIKETRNSYPITYYFNNKNYIDSINEGNSKYVFKYTSNKEVTRNLYSEGILENIAKFRYNKIGQLIDYSLINKNNKSIEKRKYNYDNQGIIQKIESFDSRFEYANYIWDFTYNDTDNSLTVVKTKENLKSTYAYIKIKSSKEYYYEYFSKPKYLDFKSTIILDENGNVSQKNIHRSNEILKYSDKKTVENWEQVKIRKESSKNGYKLLESIVDKKDISVTKKVFNDNQDLIFESYSNNFSFPENEPEVKRAIYKFYNYK